MSKKTRVKYKNITFRVTEEENKLHEAQYKEAVKKADYAPSKNEFIKKKVLA